MNFDHRNPRLRRGFAFVALAAVLGLSAVGLSQCRLVDDSVTGVDLRSNSTAFSSARSKCVHQCNEKYKQCQKAEEATHKANKKACGNDSACRKNEDVRHKVLAILADRMPPQRCAQIEQWLTAGQQDALPQLLPAEAFYLAGEFRRRFPDQTNSWGAAGKELDDLSRAHPDEVNWQRLSDDFGVPHPALEQTYAREVLNIKPFPAVSGYGCLLVAESWDSSNLYWARLADELGYPPVMLNRLAPELMRRMVEKISATDLEDYAALMRAMQETGEEFRNSKGEAVPAAIAARP